MNLVKLFLVAVFGGTLGLLFLVPLRRYFVKEMHGEFPFPEATATTEVLVAGEAGGKQAKVLVAAAAVGGVFDFLIIHLQAFSEVFTTRSVPVLRDLAEKGKLVFKLDVLASVAGLGYIIGLKYSAIICAGSFLSYFVLVPLVHAIGVHAPGILAPGATPIAEMTIDEVFRAYVRIIGVGGIAGAGILGIVSALPSMVRSIGANIVGLSHQDERALTEVPRTDRSLPGAFTIAGLVAFAVAAFLFFSFGIGIGGSLASAAVATALVMLIAFLFAPVAARAIAIVGTNPVSGMTMLTLIIACLALVATGLSGDALGMSVALVIGCAVCTALSTSGAFITDLKVGYWLGASPYQQQRWKFLGILIASLCVGAVIWVLATSYGFMVEDAAGQMVVNPDLPAPQGNLMATIVSSVMGGEQQALILFLLGGIVAVMLEMAKVPALAFGLGMYLPIEINMAVFFGAAVGHFISRSGRDEAEREARKEQGTLIASGLMAGAAIMGTIGAILLLPQVGEPMLYLDVLHASEQGAAAFASWYEGIGGQLVSVLGVAALVAACFFLAKKGAAWQMDEEDDSR